MWPDLQTNPTFSLYLACDVYADMAHNSVSVSATASGWAWAWARVRIQAGARARASASTSTSASASARAFAFALATGRGLFATCVESQMAHASSQPLRTFGPTFSYTNGQMTKFNKHFLRNLSFHFISFFFLLFCTPFLSGLPQEMLFGHYTRIYGWASNSGIIFIHDYWIFFIGFLVVFWMIEWKDKQTS